jgi:hypothetical protein
LPGEGAPAAAGHVCDNAKLELTLLVMLQVGFLGGSPFIGMVDCKRVYLM